MQIDFSQPQVQAALISVLGAMCSLFGTLYIAKRNIQKDARSRARVEWITSLREDASRLISQIDAVRRSEIEGKHDEIPEQRRELLRQQSRVLLHLGLDASDKVLAEKVSVAVRQVLDSGLAYNPESDIRDLVRLTQAAIHREWNRASHGK